MGLGLRVNFGLQGADNLGVSCRIHSYLQYSRPLTRRGIK
jgi:hypothetical protein